MKKIPRGSPRTHPIPPEGRAPLIRPPPHSHMPMSIGDMGRSPKMHNVVLPGTDCPSPPDPSPLMCHKIRLKMFSYSKGNDGGTLWPPWMSRLLTKSRGHDTSSAEWWAAVWSKSAVQFAEHTLTQFPQIKDHLTTADLYYARPYNLVIKLAHTHHHTYTLPCHAGLLKINQRRNQYLIFQYLYALWTYFYVAYLYMSHKTKYCSKLIKLTKST